jgi:hypothetical protein
MPIIFTTADSLILLAMFALAAPANLSAHATTVSLTGVNQLRNLSQIRIASARDVDLEPLVVDRGLKRLILANVTFRNSTLLKSVEIELIGESRES